MTFLNIKVALILSSAPAGAFLVWFLVELIGYQQQKSLEGY